MKKISLLLLMFVLTLVLAACSGDDAGGKEEGSGSKDGDSKSSVKVQGVTDDEILIGHLGPQTGPIAVYDVFRKGIDSYFKYVNEEGGVHGRQLKLVAYDDQYQPAKTVQLAQRLVEEDKVFATLGNVCSPCNTAAQPTFEKSGIPMVMLSSGAKQFVDPPIKNYFGSSILNYRVETGVYLDYAINQLGAKKITVIYQNDDYGKEGYEAVKDNIGNYEGAELIDELSYVAGDADLSSQAQKVSENKPDAIIMLATPNPAANFKRDLHRIGLGDIPFIVSSVGGNDLNQFELAGEAWEGTISAATFPMPELSDDPAMKLFLERFTADYPSDPTAGFAPLGWAIGQIMHEALERAGDDLEWEEFYKVMESFDQWDGSLYEGVTFGPDNHYGLLTLILTEAKDGEIIPLTGPIHFDPLTQEVTYE
ncbi:ABC transporter substrate-binding protein [Sporosarcina sp. CAU 1771]